jgi:succinylarginine dihydrolase
VREYNFDGLVGPSHNYSGLSAGNLASSTHGGQIANPRGAALEGLAKMRLVRDLGVGQAVLPPHPRPSLATLRRLGFGGPDEQVIARVAEKEPLLLRLCSSASAMWTANAATVAPSCDTLDARLHLVPANLQQMFHRAIEADTTRAVLGAIFADQARFAVHAPLPGGGQFADEGAANHTRLEVPGRPAVHLFAWGRRAFGDGPAPRRFPARQTLEASSALTRLLALEPGNALLVQQHPDGIDAGGFHTDVLAVGSGPVLLLHELAFAHPQTLLAGLREELGEGLRVVLATNAELPAADAIAAYPFNSQLLTLPDGSMAILAPQESRENALARAYLERVIAEDNPVSRVIYVDLRQSMRNGGGPACLRQRIPLTDEDAGALSARVLLDEALAKDLAAWIERNYRDRLAPADLADPALARETMTALDELTQILRLGSVYDFQRSPG